jgi:hypothetical protein
VCRCRCTKGGVSIRGDCSPGCRNFPASKNPGGGNRRNPVCNIHEEDNCGSRLAALPQASPAEENKQEDDHSVCQCASHGEHTERDDRHNRTYPEALRSKVIKIASYPTGGPEKTLQASFAARFGAGQVKSLHAGSDRRCLIRSTTKSEQSVVCDTVP